MIFWNLKNFDNFSSRNQHALIEEDLCNFDILSKLVFNRSPMTSDTIYCCTHVHINLVVLPYSSLYSIEAFNRGNQTHCELNKLDIL